MTDETDTAGEIKKPGCKQIDWIGIFGFCRNQCLIERGGGAMRQWREESLGTPYGWEILAEGS